VYGLFKPAIERFHIAPSEYWKMSITELYMLFEITIDVNQDSSLMVNEKRKLNGMDRKDLRNIL
jgi:hypothetical protein